MKYLHRPTKTVPPRFAAYAQRLQSSQKTHWGRSALLADIREQNLPPVETLGVLIKSGVLRYVSASKEEGVGHYEVLTTSLK